METSPAPNATDRGFMSQRIDCGIDPGYSPGQLMLVATADKCRWLSDLPQQKFLISLTLQVQHQLREIGDGGMSGWWVDGWVKSWVSRKVNDWTDRKINGWDAGLMDE